jgi:hypothetical protein
MTGRFWPVRRSIRSRQLTGKSTPVSLSSAHRNARKADRPVAEARSIRVMFTIQCWIVVLRRSKNGCSSVMSKWTKYSFCCNAAQGMSTVRQKQTLCVDRADALRCHQMVGELCYALILRPFWCP